MIYLDNAATSRPYPEVIELTSELMATAYFNNSSNHDMGMDIDNRIKKAKETLLKLLNAPTGELVFTSGGTESNNLAIMAKGKKHVLTTEAEHPSVSSAIAQLKNSGVVVECVALDEQGLVNLADLKSKLTPETGLVSIMEINNETGVIQDISAIGQVVKAHSKATFHVDGVAAFGKKQMNLSQVDLYTISSHKVHGPQGVGALYVRKGVNLRPMLFGGDQQNKVRPGTENRIGILGFAQAAQLTYERLEATTQQVEGLKRALQAIVTDLPAVEVNSGDCPYTLNLSFTGLKAQVLVNALSEAGIYVSTGAACSGKSNHNVLKAIGKPQPIYDSAIRFSFSQFNTLTEIEETVSVLKRLVPLLRI